jgi:hypothetical protein
MCITPPISTQLTPIDGKAFLLPRIHSIENDEEAIFDFKSEEPIWIGRPTEGPAECILAPLEIWLGTFGYLGNRIFVVRRGYDPADDVDGEER